MGIFDKLKNVAGGKSGGGASAGDSQKEQTVDDSFKRDLRKARKFFEYARTVADTGNYDYAIECYVNGLKHDPDNMNAHEELLDVGRRRKVKGGKPAGGFSLGSGGKTELDRMLASEKKMAMDPLNVKLMLDVMKHAVGANEEEAEANLGEVAAWVGTHALETLVATGKGKRAQFVEARDLFREVGVYDKAIEACKHAVRSDPNNGNLLAELKDLEAEAYSARQEESDKSIDKVKDEEGQRLMEIQESGSRTDSAREQLLGHLRAQYEEDPSDVDRLTKLVDLLLEI
ncbi:MAG: hypothetical protein MI741_21995, partial [Rhodospirillales bacterium]|nr:hypothetical protein [Rhodospirillales bacterium]